ncbi:glycoside hydrolase family 19 protein [Actinoplanes sp. NBRC 103695]|uniref:glycoside hydrolase family 19 protein n=1 Tax=Actinoplanes sp. NBRC 103695 TaxID=3032202 RepID=UPI0024A2CA9A|nr:glycoside hydrolase family 19 protein [Actinoplanes sp. NBRC 103695]GLY97113.1 chitinase [Actinoplanes sp. NBRC 103695]
MLRQRFLASVGALLVGTLAAIAPATASQAAACAGAWSASQVYVGENVASQNGHNYRAKWWTQNESPATHSGPWDVWADQGACGGGGEDPPPTGGFPLSQAQFDQRWPASQRASLYTYSGLIEAANRFPAFGSGSDVTKKREVAAFLANVDHESGQLRYTEEQDVPGWGRYCDWSRPYGCPAGQTAYHGRGPIQLSWNYNYKAAGDYLGIDLLNNPDQVKNVSSIAYQTAFWYWLTQNGPSTMTAHAAITGSAGFGGTIRAINGTLECNGANPAQVQNRVNAYLSFTQLFGVDPGGNLYC